jgi:hypothetical protein
MASTMSEILVSFHGEGSGIGELTWGQQEIWTTIRRTGRTLNIGGAMPLPTGTSIEEMVSTLRFMVGRHQALRTRLLLVAEGADVPGVPGVPEVQGPVPAPFPPFPRQIVAESGEVPLHVVDVDEGDDPVAAAEALRSRYELTPFDYAHEWPVRMAVVRQSGALTHLVVQYCHVAVDGLGIDAVVQDLANLDPATGEATAPVRGVRPLELARIQGATAGRRQSDKSLRYWETLLRGVPARRFGESADRREPRFWEIFCYSPAMHLGMQSIAARTGADTAHVLLAAYAVATARITGRNPSVAQVIVSNRFRPDFASAVSQLSQPGLCVIDAANSTFDEVVARAWKAATGAYLHGYYDTVRHREMLDRVARERGEKLDLACFVNDRRNQPGPQPGDRLPTEEDLRAALPRTTLRWDRKLPTYDGTFYLQVDSGPDANVPGRITSTEQALPAVYFAIWADTHVLSPADIEAYARELETVIVEAAFDPNVPTRIQPSPPSTA